MTSRLPTRLVTALAIAFCAACSDDDDPTGPTDPMSREEVVAECVAGTIGVVGGSDVVETGTVDDSDCYVEEFSALYEGRIEGYTLTQASFGTWDAVDIEVEADFDAVIVILDEDGNLVDFRDEDEGGDLGHEIYSLFADDAAGSPDYYIGVMSLDGEGEYSITFSGFDAALARAP